MFSFSLISRNLLISSFISSMTHWSLAMCSLDSNCLHVFYYCFCCWVLVLMHCDHIECMVLFLFSYICWGLLCDLRYDQFWRMIHGLLRRMYIVQWLDKIFCRHQLGPFVLWYVFDLGFPYWFFVWMTYLLVMWGINVSHYHCVAVCMFLGPSEYVWWNWVHSCCVHLGW
jgi:hypothetical protein